MAKSINTENIAEQFADVGVTEIPEVTGTSAELVKSIFEHNPDKSYTQRMIVDGLKKRNLPASSASINNILRKLETAGTLTVQKGGRSKFFRWNPQ